MPAEPEPHKLAMLLADVDALAKRRRRLSSLSWFMRSICEPIAHLSAFWLSADGVLPRGPRHAWFVTPFHLLI